MGEVSRRLDITVSAGEQTYTLSGLTDRQSPSCGKPAAYDKACEWNDSSARQDAVFENPPKPADGLFHLPTGPGLGLQINEAELAKRRVPIA
jgi:hypothetical protein